MRVLIVRLSSMGDVVQTLPAVNDARNANPNLQIDWVVDHAFSEIPAWHPGVAEVIASPQRRLSNLRTPEFAQFLKQLRTKNYDFIIDLQGHWKSATASRFAKGIHCGYTGNSVNEWGAHVFYGKKFSVPKNVHSITRMRQLMALVLDYDFDRDAIHYGIDRTALPANFLQGKNPYMVFIHSTSWDSKNWAEQHWQVLRENAIRSGFDVVLPWGTEAERKRAERIAETDPKTRVLPELSISQKAAVLADAAATVGLDTGLSHIAAALGVPSVSLYGATDPRLTGAMGANQFHIASNFECVKCHRSVCNHKHANKPACFSEITPDRVWEALTTLLASR